MQLILLPGLAQLGRGDEDSEDNLAGSLVIAGDFAAGDGGSSGVTPEPASASSGVSDPADEPQDPGPVLSTLVPTSGIAGTTLSPG